MDSEDKKKLKKLIARRHPDYEETVSHWDFLDACYQGGREWFKKHVFQYVKEGDNEFKERVKRAFRFNHSREIVDLVNKYIFKAEIVRNEKDAPPSVKRFWKSATRNDLNIDQYMRQISIKSSTFGRVWAVVDNTAGGQKVNTVAEEAALGIRTYSYVLKPQDVLDMSYDDFGDLNWILLKEVARDDVDPMESSGGAISRYKLWTRTEWTIFQQTKTGNTINVDIYDEGVHDLGVVPVVKIDHIETDDLYKSPSLIGDIAYLDRAVANYLSNLDAIIQDQTFSQLAMPAQGLLPGDKDFDKLTEMGTKRMFTFDGEGGVAPFYLSPDPKQAEIIVTVVQKIINEIYHSVGMAGERTKSDNSAGIDNSSGVAKAYDFERVNALLASKADALDRAEEKIVHLVKLWSGDEIGEDDENLIHYPQDFDVRGLYDEFDIASQLSLVAAPDSVRREQMKSLIDKLFPRLEKKLKEEMISDLKEWPPAAPEPISGGSVLTDALGKSQSPDGDDDASSG